METFGLPQRSIMQKKKSLPHTRAYIFFNIQRKATPEGVY